MTSTWTWLGVAMALATMAGVTEAGVIRGVVRVPALASSSPALDPYPGLAVRQPALVAAVLYRDFSRGRDDVTVVVGRRAP